MLCIGFILTEHFSNEIDIVPLNLDMYHDANILYRVDTKYNAFGENYKAIAEEFNGNAIKDEDTDTGFVNGKNFNNLISLTLITFFYALTTAERITNILIF